MFLSFGNFRYRINNTGPVGALDRQKKAGSGARIFVKDGRLMETF